ncbi:MAG TPA: sensor histidine kinase [Anaerolineae bacterium]|nr:sensor histidine kinase [Anaerolineae bacterium]
MVKGSRPPALPDNLAAQRILAVTEEELRRIVLDIHDGPVQQLFAGLSQLSLMQGRLGRGETIPNEEWIVFLNRLSGMLGQSLHEIRNLLGTFRPPEFATSHLAHMIQGLVIQHEAFTGCQVVLDVDEQPMNLPLPAKIALYRICQEALSNAYRHSGAEEQWVTLERVGDEVLLVVADKGKGFVPPPLSGPNATERAEHIGLRGMRDRVELVGGKFKLESAPGEGTQISVKFPLEADGYE